VLTHAAAAVSQAGVRLAALCDRDPERLEAAGADRGITALYPDAESLLAQEPIDIAVIATPTALRTTLIERALDAGVRTFVLEKPLAATLDEAETLAKTLREAGALVTVNYLRRHAPGLQAVAERLRSGRLGAVQYANVHYGKGLNNNGSHGIDLVRWWLGEPVSATVTGRVDDGRDGDPTLQVSFSVRSGEGLIPVGFHGSDHREVSVFEVDVICAGGRVRMTDRGATVTWSQVAPDPTFPGYTALADEAPVVTGLERAVAELWSDLVAVMAGQRVAPRCTLEDALALMRIVAATRAAEATGQTVALATDETVR